MDIGEVAILEKLGNVLAGSILEVLGVANDHPGQLAKITGFPLHRARVAEYECLGMGLRGSRGQLDECPLRRSVRAKAAGQLTASSGRKAVGRHCANVGRS